MQTFTNCAVVTRAQNGGEDDVIVENVGWTAHDGVELLVLGVHDLLGLLLASRGRVMMGGGAAAGGGGGGSGALLFHLEVFDGFGEVIDGLGEVFDAYAAVAWGG